MKVGNVKVLANVCSMILITAEGVPWNWVPALWVKKWNGGATRSRQMFGDIFSLLDRIHIRDRRQRQTTMAADDSEDCGGLQMVMADDVRRR